MPQPPQIIIRDEQFSNPLSPNKKRPDNLKIGEEEKSGLRTKALIVSAISAAGRQVINNALSNVGNRTGNRGQQIRINNTLKAIGIGSGILESAGAGFALGGPIGAGIGAIIGAGKATLDIAIEVDTYNIEINKEELNRQFLLESQVFSNLNKRSVR